MVVRRVFVQFMHPTDGARHVGCPVHPFTKDASKLVAYGCFGIGIWSTELDWLSTVSEYAGGRRGVRVHSGNLVGRPPSWKRVRRTSLTDAIQDADQFGSLRDWCRTSNEIRACLRHSLPTMLRQWNTMASIWPCRPLSAMILHLVLVWGFACLHDFTRYIWWLISNWRLNHARKING